MTGWKYIAYHFALSKNIHKPLTPVGSSCPPNTNSLLPADVNPQPHLALGCCPITMLLRSFQTSEAKLNSKNPSRNCTAKYRDNKVSKCMIFECTIIHLRQVPTSVLAMLKYRKQRTGQMQAKIQPMQRKASTHMSQSLDRQTHKVSSQMMWSRKSSLVKGPRQKQDH